MNIIWEDSRFTFILRRYVEHYEKYFNNFVKYI